MTFIQLQKYSLGVRLKWLCFVHSGVETVILLEMYINTVCKYIYISWKPLHATRSNVTSNAEGTVQSSTVKLKPDKSYRYHLHIDGLVQDCSNPIANALELLPYCTKTSKQIDTCCQVRWLLINIPQGDILRLVKKCSFLVHNIQVSPTLAESHGSPGSYW